MLNVLIGKYESFVENNTVIIKKQMIDMWSFVTYTNPIKKPCDSASRSLEDNTSVHNNKQIRRNVTTLFQTLRRLNSINRNTIKENFKGN